MKSARRKSLRQIPDTLAEALKLCPFRSFIGLPGGGLDDMAGRLSHTFAALGGEPSPINPDLLAEMVGSIRRGRTVLVISNQADLRDYAKREILAQVHGVAGCA